MSNVIEILKFASFALLGGILPALLWLWFWLRQDLHPEPKKIILLTFLAGMFTIPAAFLTEYGIYKMFLKLNLAKIGSVSIPLIFILAGVEEYFKYLAAKYTALKRKCFDEPVDAMVYLITAALGFAAIENSLYIFQGFTNSGILVGLFSGNLRFLGASLVHVVSSGALGASIAFSFFHKKNLKRNLFFGFCTAIILHGAFNYFIISTEGSLFKIFLTVWVFTAAILYVFERVKKS